MMDKNVPVANPKASYMAHADEIDAAIQRVLESGHYILGKEVESFEGNFADVTGAQYAVGVGSGTDAVALSLVAAGVARDDEVITVSHTAVATVAAIEQIGAIPVFVDINSESMCIDPRKLQAAISPRTKAIVAVHIYGRMADMQAIMAIANEYGLLVIEDCAQAHGAKIDGKHAGTFAHAGAFSFYPTKNLGCIGDGGAIITNSADIYQKLKMIREYGWQTRFDSVISGINSRLDEIQAAILNVKLPHLDREIERRNEIALRYSSSIDANQLGYPIVVAGQTHAMHLYVVQTDRRDQFMEYMQANNISTAVHYPIPVHKQQAYMGRIRCADALVNTETISGQIVTLPMFAQMSDEQVETVCTALTNWSEL
jgi:dTDP-4-amino-4,6-dideoxygalactose transaminase